MIVLRDRCDGARSKHLVGVLAEVRGARCAAEPDPCAGDVRVGARLVDREERAADGAIRELAHRGGRMLAFQPVSAALVVDVREQSFERADAIGDRVLDGGEELVPVGARFDDRLDVGVVLGATSDQFHHDDRLG